MSVVCIVTQLNHDVDYRDAIARLQERVSQIENDFSEISPLNLTSDSFR